MRALYPDEDGYVDRDGIKIFYEIYGSGRPTVVLMPTWSIIHSRFWKMQIPYLARHFRVVTFDGRGNGKSGRPAEADAYAESEFVKDTLAVMDVTETQSAVLVCLSLGAQRTLLLGADHPDRVEGAVFIGASLPIAPGHPERSVYSFDDRLKARRLGQVQPALLDRRLQRISSVLLREVLYGAPLDEADRGLCGLGPGDGARDSGRYMHSAMSRSQENCVSWSPTSMSTGSPRIP